MCFSSDLWFADYLVWKKLITHYLTHYSVCASYFICNVQFQVFMFLSQPWTSDARMRWGLSGTISPHPSLSSNLTPNVFMPVFFASFPGNIFCWQTLSRGGHVGAIKQGCDRPSPDPGWQSAVPRWKIREDQWPVKVQGGARLSGWPQSGSWPGSPGEENFNFR